MENFVTSAVYADNKLFVTDLNWVVYEVNPQTGEMSKAFSDSSEKVNRLIAAGTEFALMTDKGIQFADAKSGALAERMQTMTCCSRQWVKSASHITRTAIILP